MPTRKPNTTKTYFSSLVGSPTKEVLTKKFPKADNYDIEIRGWVKYWNDIFSPKELLDPNLIKALIATESNFDIDPKPNDNAHGLMLNQKYVCIAGSFDSKEEAVEDGTLRKVYFWTFDNIKTKKGSDS